MTGIEAIGADNVLSVVTAALDVVMRDGGAREVGVYRAITVTDRANIIGVDLNGNATGAIIVVILIVRARTDTGEVRVVSKAGSDHRNFARSSGYLSLHHERCGKPRISCCCESQYSGWQWHSSGARVRCRDN